MTSATPHDDLKKIIPPPYTHTNKGMDPFGVGVGVPVPVPTVPNLKQWVEFHRIGMNISM